MKKQILLNIVLLLLLSCSPSPRPIDYGNVECAYCKMTIVDSQHAAQLVSSKGKVFNFDAIECMIPFRQNSDASFSHVLVNNYNIPKMLIDAQRSTFLISDNIPSPMGAFLSAVPQQHEAMHLVNVNGGDIYTWNEIQDYITMEHSNL